MYVEQNYSFAILRPIQEAILNRGGKVAWFITGKEANRSLIADTETLLSTVEQVQAFKPIAVFVPGNVVPNFFPGVKVGVFHGFFAGKHGNSHFNIRGFFDLYCPQGPNTTGPFQELAKKHGFFRVVQTGWSKLDPLFKANNAQLAAKQNNSIKDQSADKPTILFASTFSKIATCAPYVFETVKRLSESGEWNWLVTLHPKMDKEIVAKYKSLEGENLRFIENSGVLSALQEADVMLCDTSSIISEFIVLQKPVVTYKTIKKGDHLIDIDNINDIENSLRYALQKPPELMRKIIDFGRMIHPDTDGQSSERVLDAVDWFIETGHKGLKKKPLNLLRKYKIRKKLGYFKF
jgi:CDP-glycerol glycerophosphotransferase (TagB/SpsB family)